MNQRELLTTVEESWRQLDAALDGLDEAAMVEPGVVEAWSVKDLLGHVTAWDQMALGHVERWRRGEQPPAAFSVDDYNAREAARRRDWSPATVREEAAETRQQLRSTLAAVTDDEWSAVVGEGDQQGPLGDWIGGPLAGSTGPGTHAAEHAEHIRAWRAARERREA